MLRQKSCLAGTGEFVVLGPLIEHKMIYGHLLQLGKLTLLLIMLCQV
jgi:hypothetical protein